MLFGGKGSIGLDIGSSYIKTVKLKESKGTYELDLFDIHPLPPELIVDRSIIDSIRLVDSLKEMIKKTGIKTKDTVISMSGHSSVIIKRISLPEMSEEELSESIKFEAEQYVPFDIEDVNLDFQIIGPKDEPGQMDVILVAVKKDIINEYISVVKEAGLNPIVVDIDSFALENMYGINYEISPDKNVALLNIGASTINLSILKGGISLFTRDSSLGSNLHTEALQREFNISYENAEKLKRGEAIENVNPEDATSVIEAASEEILSEIVRSFDYYRSTTVHEDIAEVILSGGCALLKNFASLISDRTGIETRVAEPFRNVRIPKRFDKAYIEETAPMMAVAVGLALRKQGDR
ncbi:MAG: type IV pilus assembly protein PilM [Nitrospirae bacterium]|nr:type IV pilus assembly protein PilM [Nitrospirota bacterium]